MIVQVTEAILGIGSPGSILSNADQWDTYGSKRDLFELRDIGWIYRKIHQKYPDIPLSTIHYTIKRHNQQSVSDPSHKEMECERSEITPKNAEKRRKWAETYVHYTGKDFFFGLASQMDAHLRVEWVFDKTILLNTLNGRLSSEVSTLFLLWEGGKADVFGCVLVQSKNWLITARRRH